MNDDPMSIQLSARLYGSVDINAEQLRLLQSAAWRDGYQKGKEGRRLWSLFRKARGMLIDPYGGEL